MRLGQPALGGELVEVLCVVVHLVVPAKLRVLVLEGVEAVRAVGDDLLDLVAVERFHVLPSKHLVEHFVSGTPGEVARAFFLAPKDGKAHSGLFHQGCGRLGDLLVAAVERSGATHPHQHVQLIRIALGHEGDVEILGPIRPLVEADAPRIEVTFQPFVSGVEFLRLGLLHHGLALTHGKDAGHMFDGDGAGVLAGAAGGAGPERILRNHVADEGFAVAGLARPEQAALFLAHVVEQGDVEVLERERLVGDIGGTDIKAAPAFGAGIEVKPLLPSELLQARHADALLLPCGLVFQVQQRDWGVRTVERTQEDVGQGGDFVKLLGVDEDVHKGEHHQNVPPEAEVVEEGVGGLSQRREDSGEEGRKGRPFHLGAVHGAVEVVEVVVPVLNEVEAASVKEQVREHDRADVEQHIDALPVEREPLGLGDDAAVEHDQHPGQHHHFRKVVHENVGESGKVVGPQQRQVLLKALDKALAHQREFAGTNEDRAPEDEGVDDSGTTLAAAVQKFLLAQADADQRTQTPQGLVQPLFRCQAPQHSEFDDEVERKHPPCDQHDEQHQPGIHGGSLIRL